MEFVYIVDVCIGAGLAIISLVGAITLFYAIISILGLNKTLPTLMERGKRGPMPLSLVQEISEKAFRVNEKGKTPSVSCRKYCDTSCMCETIEDCRYDSKNYPKWNGEVTTPMLIAVTAVWIFLLVKILTGK